MEKGQSVGEQVETVLPLFISTLVISGPMLHPTTPMAPCDVMMYPPSDFRMDKFDSLT